MDLKKLDHLYRIARARPVYATILVLALILLFGGAAFVSQYCAEKGRQAAVFDESDTPSIGCSLRPVTIPIKDDTDRAFLWNIGPRLDARSPASIRTESGNTAVVIDTGNYGLINLFPSESKLKTFEFAIRNNGDIDLSLIKVAYFQLVWDFDARGTLLTAMNMEIDLATGFTPPRDYHERGPARDWFVSRDLEVGDVYRKPTYPPISLLNPSLPLVDALVFTARYRSDSDTEMRLEECIFVVRGGSVYSAQKYEFDDAFDLKTALDTQTMRLLENIENRQP